MDALFSYISIMLSLLYLVVGFFIIVFLYSKEDESDTVFKAFLTFAIGAVGVLVSLILGVNVFWTFLQFFLLFILWTHD